MSEEGSESSHSREGGEKMQNATSIEALMRELRASRCTLEKLFIDTFQSFVDHPAEWTTEAYNDRAELLSQKGSLL